MSSSASTQSGTNAAASGLVAGKWWHRGADDRIVCDLCPRECKLHDGDRGFCFVRQNIGGEMMLTTYNRSTGFCVDPIEKKPLNHFYPGTSVLSFGTAGCNLGCRFCQNWDISKSREVERLSEQATPEDIARAAKSLGCHSVAFTYNDPVIWAEYAIDCAKACHDLGIKTVAVTAGYISPGARKEFYEHMDAANVDLKAFTEQFYHKLCFAELTAVLDTLRWLKHESNVWFEITTLLIPEENDSPEEAAKMCDWLLKNVGDEVPLHFTAFHPDFKLRNRPPTPPETLARAREIALKAGLKYVYVGNVHDVARQSTYCPNCGASLIERDWHAIVGYRMKDNRCGKCGHIIAGHFEAKPGTWGNKRLPVKIQSETVTPRPRAASGPPSVDANAEKQILAFARGLVAAALGIAGETPPLPAAIAQQSVFGAFVSLQRGETLRSCRGLWGRNMTVESAVRAAAKSAATEDNRFTPITADEFSALDIEVSLMHSPQPMRAVGETRTAEVKVGTHGLIIAMTDKRGVLLPHVATEAGLDSKGFLDMVCRKAGLPVEAWRSPESSITTFQTRVLSTQPASLPVAMIQKHADNLMTIARGLFSAVAMGQEAKFQLPDALNCELSGLLLVVQFAGETLGRWSKVTLGGGLLLSRAFAEVLEAAAAALVSSKKITSAQVGNLDLSLMFLHRETVRPAGDTGWVATLDSKRQALLVLHGDRNGIALPPAEDGPAMLQRACNSAGVTDAASATYYTFDVLVIENRAQAQATPRPAPPVVSGERMPAKAGMFYPADARELDSMVQRCTAFARGNQRWPAIMVPHAGLRFSGALAGQTFCRVRLPKMLIVLSPKHTRLGLPWAVSPDHTWLYPGASVASNTSAAQSLTQAVNGLQFDRAAHAQEHGIEVELPLIHALAPDSAVIGIVIGAGDYDDCRRFARGLAEFVRGLPEPPLLVISSDLNHYAPEPENRRLDTMAIEAARSLDARQLFETCRGNRISMCGLLPAVVVMETLKELGQLRRAELIGYTNSASTTGDTSRVVGYAGMLFG